MCDKGNPQDKKLLLLAELMESKCSGLSENQNELKQSLNKTNEKLDKLTDLLEKYEDYKNSCPVWRNRDEFERMSVFFKNPKIAFFVIVGIFALLVGTFSSGFMDTLKFLLKS